MVSKLSSMEKCVWDALAEQAMIAKAQPLASNFLVTHFEQNSLFSITKQKCIEAGLIADNEKDRISWNKNWVSLAVADIYYSAINLGLLIPCHLGQDLDHNAGYGTYQFTERGINSFESGEISISTPGLLIQRIEELSTQYQLNAGIIPLVEEAQRCWQLGCLRATTVMIGLASEDTCLRLLDEFNNYPSPPLTGTTYHQNWSNMLDEILAFYSRWRGGLQILKHIKDSLRSSYGNQKPEWWRVWEPVPGAIEPYERL